MAFWITAILLVVVASLAWNFTSRAAYESAEYTVAESDGGYEIRDYPDLMLVSTDMRSAAQGGDSSFMRLFRYIRGANQTDQKVAMTTPVLMEEGNKDSAGRMGFVIPKEVVSKGVPQPVAADVEVRQRQGGRFAVIRFAGRMNAKLAEQSETRLRQWIKGRGLDAADQAELAGYDPPWTPGPLRRNEVLIRLSN